MNPNPTWVEDGVDENEDEEEEEAQGGKEDESKLAIKWTEDDEKNLMDLGTSELERNQCLENLISRRWAWKNMRLVAEKNLINLDGADLPHLGLCRKFVPCSVCVGSGFLPLELKCFPLEYENRVWNTRFPTETRLLLARFQRAKSSLMDSIC